MKQKIAFLRDIIFPVGLVLLLIWTIYSFINLERVRHEIEQFSRHDYQIRLSFSKPILHLTQVKNYLQTLQKTGYLFPDIEDQLIFANTKIHYILDLQYIKDFLSPVDIERLREIYNFINSEILSDRNIISDPKKLVVFIPDIEKSITDISGMISDLRVAQKKISQSELNIFNLQIIIYFIMILILLSIIGFLLLQKKKLVEERKEYFH